MRVFIVIFLGVFGETMVLQFVTLTIDQYIIFQMVELTALKALYMNGI